MAIARVTSGSGDSGGTASTTTISITGFTVSGVDKVLYVVVMANEPAVLSPDPTVVWDSAGANQNFGAPIKKSTGTGTYIAVYRLINPTDGASKIISISGMSATVRDAAAAVLYSGVDQVTPNDAEVLQEVASQASPYSSSTITSPAGDAILGFYARETNTTSPTVTGGGNVLVVAKSVSGTNGYCAIAEDLDGADDTIDWAFSTSTIPISLVTFNVNASVSTLPFVMLEQPAVVTVRGQQAMPPWNTLGSGLLTSQPPFFTTVDGKRVN